MTDEIDTQTWDFSGGPSIEIEGLSHFVEIGRGAFAVVYRAQQATLDRVVAVKVLTQRVDDDSFASFARESKALGTLSGHSKIVTVHATGTESNGLPFIIMEYMARGSMQDRIADGPVAWDEATAIALDIATALVAAHKAEIVHRDVKPANILISDFDEVKLGDFGIARLHGLGATQTGMIAATPQYMAPELVSGVEANPGTDVYSLGCTLFALLHGSPAFVGEPGEHFGAFIARAAFSPVPDLRPDGVPDAVCRVVEDAMHRDPEQRIQTAQELADRLSECGGTQKPPGRRTKAEKSNAGIRSKKRWSRAKVWIGALVAAALIAIAGLVYLVASDSTDESPSAGVDRRPVSTEKAATAVLSAANEERATRDVPALEAAPDLEQSATEHARELARSDTLDITPRADIEAISSGKYSIFGENEANGADLPSVLESIRNSSTHVKNEVDPTYDVIGVGAAWRSDGEVLYVVQYFARRIPTAADPQAGS